MSKYDFEIDLSLNSSTGMILNEIVPGSTVLEFGCAAGRMTRYMKEALGCRVYIVEYDEGAYKKALEYAEDGICDDIMTFRWVQRFSGIDFDAIIFADVLEHLMAPEKVLEEASKLLKDSGSVYASVPNITHNDILLKAFSERFDYTATGLLDDSHIHFWGLENIWALSGKCGLRIREIRGTHCATGDSEQSTDAGNALLKNILRERRCGEVYQFVVSLDKGGEGEVSTQFRPSFVKSHIYLDSGKGFNGDELISLDSEFTGEGSYRAHYVLEETEGLRAIRFDPVELQGCILRSLSIRQGEHELMPIFGAGFETEGGILLSGTDPMVYANVFSGRGSVTIDAEIVLPGETYLEVLEASCVHYHTVAEELGAWKRDAQGELVAMSKELSAKSRELTALRAENEALQLDVQAYITLATNKDKHILGLEQELTRYRRLPGVRLAAFIRKASDFAMRIAGKILKKAFRIAKKVVKRIIGREGQV